MHRPTKPLTADEVRALLNYDEQAGVFTWRARPRMKAGARAGSLDTNGRRYIRINGHWYQAQRLAWLYVHGEEAPRYIRFADDNTDNCAIANLSCPEPRPYEMKLAKDRARTQAQPAHFRGYNLKRDFGITLEQYQDVFAAQGGVCACCQRPEVSERDGKRKWLAVDHDHSDGSFRGLLCSSCNQMLGRAKDDAGTLLRAAAYLDAHAAKPKTNVIPLAGRRIANQRGN